MKQDAMQTYEYHVWANDRVFRHLKELPGEVWQTKLQSVFPSIADALAHVYQTDFVWLSSMAGDSFDEVVSAMGRIRQESTGTSVEKMEVLFHDMASRYRAFLDGRDSDDTRPYQHPQYGTLHASYSEIIGHVVNHGTYHRGNIAAMLRQIGHPGVPTDYIYYLFALNGK